MSNIKQLIKNSSLYPYACQVASMKTTIKSYIQYVRYEIYKTLEKEKYTENLPIKFVIFSSPRSGSTLLCNMLNQHPQILCYHEIFHPKKIFYGQNISNNIGVSTVQERDRNTEKFLARIWANSFNNRAIGFKIFPNQNSTAASLILKDRKVRKILLVRRNQIKSFVSYLIALKTNKWCATNKNISQDKERQKVLVKVNVESLYNWIQANDKYYESIRQKLRVSRQSFLEINYEDLVGVENELVKLNMSEFIGVPGQLHMLRTTLKKQNSDDLTNLISNFNELEKKLRGTELAALLYS